ncbi:MAG: FKBP-type peptidylprolyl isomerase [Sphingobacteriales bacterium]|nr:MAG: FKBP-type peptidylprolyl isomerase [Sphingobacteriales bacterium]
MKQLLSAAALCMLLFSSCIKSEKAECGFGTCSNTAPSNEVASLQAYLNSAGIANAEQHCTGAYFIILNPGTGATPTACSTVNVTYEGKLTNNTVFAESTTTDLSLGQVIVGWRSMVPMLKVGGKIRMFIPPSLAYGSTPRPNIPANSILIFDVTLNNVY